MKKIIWIFGQLGSGKKTLAKNIIENNNGIRETLNINSDKIMYIDEQNDNRILYSGEIFNRSNLISKCVSNFLSTDNEILMIIGYPVDYISAYINSLKKLSIDYSDVEKEIFLLNVDDLNLLYERLVETDWFKSDILNGKKFPRHWLDVAVQYMKKELCNCENIGYSITEINTTDGYIISSKEQVKTI